jgi:hypothetical protein
MDEWNLNTDVEASTAVVIAKARWIYHCERCKLKNNQRKTLDIDILIERLELALRRLGKE